MDQEVRYVVKEVRTPLAARARAQRDGLAEAELALAAVYGAARRDLSVIECGRQPPGCPRICAAVSHVAQRSLARLDRAPPLACVALA